MLPPTVIPLAIAAAIGFAIGAERQWRGFKGSAPFHVAPALIGAWIVTRQTGLTALFWFMPLQVLLWLIIIATVCMWGAERSPDKEGEFRGSGGLGLSWTLAFLLGTVCAFQAWVLLAAACTGLIVLGLRTPRRVTETLPVAASTPAADTLEQSGSGEAVSGNPAHVDLPGVDADTGGAAEPAVDSPFVEPQRAQVLLERSAA